MPHNISILELGETVRPAIALSSAYAPARAHQGVQLSTGPLQARRSRWAGYGEGLGVNRTVTRAAVCARRSTFPVLEYRAANSRSGLPASVFRRGPKSRSIRPHRDSVPDDK